MGLDVGSTHQVRNLPMESSRKPRGHVESEILLPSLNIPDIVAVTSHAFGEILLRKVQLETAPSNGSAQPYAVLWDVVVGHGEIAHHNSAGLSTHYSSASWKAVHGAAEGNGRFPLDGTSRADLLQRSGIGMSEIFFLS